MKLDEWEEDYTDLDEEDYGEDYEDEAYEEDGEDSARGEKVYLQRRRGHKRNGNRSRKALTVLVTTVIILTVIILVVIIGLCVFKVKKDSKNIDVQAIALATEQTDGLSGQMTGQTEQVIGEMQEPDAARESSDSGKEEQEQADTGTEQKPSDDMASNDEPQTVSMSSEQGTEVDVSALLSAGGVTETADVTVGIDVAKYQGTIDWSQVAASGIDFVMVRAGYRADKTREICADSNARYNMQEASKNNIKVGCYFFSTAVSVQEAEEEADWVADYISQYQITYPVAYDCEGFDSPESAQYGLSNAGRTDIALAFLNRICERGYTPMFYASMSELSGGKKWDTDRIENSCKVWVSQYPAAPYPQTAKSSYSGVHAMWQYTNRGTVAGIGKPVDVNIAYFGYEGIAGAQNGEAPEQVDADAEALMKFTAVNEMVTAKDSTNLRSIPSQGSDSAVVYTLHNGETAARTGVSDSGWSRLTFEGQTLYAVSSYLTTDLSYQTAPAAQEGAGSGDGLKTRFTERNEQVTAKIEVNLRALPSVTNPDATVIAVLHNGEYVTRTGINEEYGWSRVDYNGQTLYCISSYLTQ